MSLLPFRKKEAPPSAADLFIQREFAEAIALAARDWKGFDAHFSHVDPEWHDKYTLRRRIGAFTAGPIFEALDHRFPEISAIGADIDTKSGLEGHKFVILEGIVAEGIIASGTNRREEVRTAREGGD